MGKFRRLLTTIGISVPPSENDSLYARISDGRMTQSGRWLAVTCRPRRMRTIDPKRKLAGVRFAARNSILLSTHRNCQFRGKK
jgi:hypothetical protein